ncbi:hypothetical protein L596_027406 [Steinernema carpocapsae]|uniref:Uncharacterized protein n=1 Tax=Steinernema carpocapsae TaxID=34508 RepID=A0A4U5M481_STECR|nr:hypothetical protein L596_027406 [Steinernema carpocapsae]
MKVATCERCNWDFCGVSGSLPETVQRAMKVASNRYLEERGSRPALAELGSNFKFQKSESRPLEFVEFERQQIIPERRTANVGLVQFEEGFRPFEDRRPGPRPIHEQNEDDPDFGQFERPHGPLKRPPGVPRPIPHEAEDDSRRIPDFGRFERPPGPPNAPKTHHFGITGHDSHEGSSEYRGHQFPEDRTPENVNFNQRLPSYSSASPSNLKSLALMSFILLMIA